MLIRSSYFCISHTDELQEPIEEFDFNGKEASVIVYFSDGALNVQSMSRARQLLIIVTDYRYVWTSMYIPYEFGKILYESVFILIVSVHC